MADVDRPLVRAARPPSRRTQLRSKPLVQLVGLIVVSIVAIGGAIDGWRASHTVALDPQTLDREPQVGRTVRVDCGAIVDPDVRIAGDDVDDTTHLALCPVQGRALVVVADEAVRDPVLVGKLQVLTGEEVWASAKLGAIHPRAYLDLTTRSEDRLVTGMVTLLGLGAIAGWWMFARRMLRERQRRLAA